MEKRIESSWLDYRSKVVPKYISDDVLNVARQTFYAGALSMFNIIVNLPGFDGEATEQNIIRDLLSLGELQQELSDFIAEITPKGGQA
jgi:hypothetical protein